MAGVGDEGRQQPAIAVVGSQQRKVVVDRAIWRAAVGCERHPASARGDAGRLAAGEGLQGNLHESLKKQLARPVDVGLVLRRDRHTKERWRDIVEHRGGVGVGGRDRQPLTGQAGSLP